MNPNPQMIWRLPAWFTEHADWIRETLMPHFENIAIYHQWHDCGKPYCKTIDEDGKVHYPDHAETSAKIWNSLTQGQTDPWAKDNRWIGCLIRDDMLCHQLRPADAEAFALNPNAVTLLTTALCELHANASMFGGLESDSFKIKYKRLDKCGATILNKLTKE